MKAKTPLFASKRVHPEAASNPQATDKKQDGHEVSIELTGPRQKRHTSKDKRRNSSGDASTKTMTKEKKLGQSHLSRPTSSVKKTLSKSFSKPQLTRQRKCRENYEEAVHVIERVYNHKAVQAVLMLSLVRRFNGCSFLKGKGVHAY